MQTSFIISTFIVSITIGSLPIFFVKVNKFKSLIKYSDNLTRGLFLGIGLTHLLPEAANSFIQNNPNSSSTFIYIVCASVAILLQGFEEATKRISSKKTCYSSWMPYFLMIVLSIHSLLEGFVLGIESNFKYAMTIFIAIMAHKGAETFSLITSMVTNKIKTTITSTCLVTFSLITPIGIALGNYLTSNSLMIDNYSIQPFFDAMAAGTFIYMSISHNKCRIHSSGILSNVISGIGFLIMAVLSQFI